MLNKNVICIESSNNDFKINEIYVVQEVQTDFCIKSDTNKFYRIFEIKYPNIKAKSLLGHLAQFKFQKQESL